MSSLPRLRNLVTQSASLDQLCRLGGRHQNRLHGGLAVFKLQTLDPLITVAETEDLAKEKKTA